MNSSSIIEHYEQLYAQQEKYLPGQDLDWLMQHRQEALKQFVLKGFPSTQLEDWKYTKCDHLSSFKFEAVSLNKNSNKNFDEFEIEKKIASIIFEDVDYIIFVNGYFWKKKIIESLNFNVDSVDSLSKQFQIKNNIHLELLKEKFSCLINQSNNFHFLNSAFWTDGLFIYSSRNFAHPKPLHVIYVTTDEAQNCYVGTHNFIYLEPEAKLTLVEHYVHVGKASNNYFNNSVSEIFLNKEAQCIHYRVMNEGSEGSHLNYTCTFQDHQSDYQHYSLALNGHWQRHEVDSLIHGIQVHTSLNGLFIANDNQFIDYHTKIHHQEAHGISDEIFFGILDDTAKAVFNAKTIVDAKANQTKAQQQNKNLLLSPTAEMNTKPELEIYAKDIVCSHGATVGQLSLEALTYLQMRGISEDVAKYLLLQGFVHQWTEYLPNSLFKAKIQTLISDKLQMIASKKGIHHVE